MKKLECVGWLSSLDGVFEKGKSYVILNEGDGFFEMESEIGPFVVSLYEVVCVFFGDK